MENSKKVYCPTINVVGNTWQIKDYKLRIVNKINKERINRLEKHIKIEEVSRLITIAKKRFGILNDLEALKLINRELTLKQMERYKNEKSSERGR